MTKYLITLSIGPVQDFIVAARRTRDLWMGSHVLSEVSKAVAKSLHDNKASLIFPASDNPAEDLKPKETHQDAFNVGNKLLAVVETDDPAGILQTAKQAAQERWEEIARVAKNRTKIQINHSLWNQQVNDVLELFAAWVEFEDASYKEKRECLDRLLNARKNTREFIQNPITTDGIPKSSLDGLRENIIDHVATGSDPWVFRRAGMNENEYLDVTGVVKRLGANPDQFTPLSRLAIDPWLRGLPDSIDFKEINQCLSGLVKYGLCSRVSGNNGLYETLPYDGQLLYPYRLNAEKNKLVNEKDEQAKQALQLLNELEQILKQQNCYQHNAEPFSYMAIMAADGDRMGKLLDAMQSENEHRNISKKLTEFASQVPGIVREFQGHCVYAGGDDVLALLPLDKAIKCSRKLAGIFKQTIEEIIDCKEIQIPTLSVGLGISHFMTPMPKQLDLARKAEKLAKSNELPTGESKNALAIIFQPRSGAAISFREHWDYDNKANSAETILNNWINAHTSERIPRQAGYNLRDESIALDWCNDKPEYTALIKAETRRILERKLVKDSDGNENKLDEQLIEAICERAGSTDLRKTANELIMTYRFAQASKQAVKKQQELHDD